MIITNTIISLLVSAYMMALLLVEPVAPATQFTSIQSGRIVNGLNVTSGAYKITAGEKDSTFKWQVRLTDTMRVFFYVQVGMNNIWGAEFQIDSGNATTAVPNWRYMSITGDSLMNQFMPWDGTIPAQTRTDLKASGVLSYRFICRGHGALLKPSNGASTADTTTASPPISRPEFEVFRVTNL